LGRDVAEGIESFVFGIGALWILVAGGAEASLRSRKHPRRYLYAWLMWTPLAMLFIGGGSASTGLNAVAVVVVALLIGPIIYPIASLMAELYVRTHQPARQELWDDLQRARYRPTDFGSNDEPCASERHLSTAPAPPPPLRGPPPP
jgi:hypothetical protein